MKTIGFDLLIIGASFGVGGSLILAKAYLHPSFPDEVAQAFFGSNPFQVRNALSQRYEAIAGAIWLAVSLIASPVGSILTTQGIETLSSANLWTHTFLLLFLGSFAWFVTIKITKWLSRRTYIPRMIEMQRELFDLASEAITYGGFYKREVDAKANLDTSTRESRLAEATRRLEQIGKLLDIPRTAAETDSQYSKRLQPFFKPGDSNG